MNVKYLKSNGLEIESVVELHMSQLKDGVLYLIGKKSLLCLYKSILKARNDLILAVSEDCTIGYITLINKEFSNLRTITPTGWLCVFISLINSPSFFFKIAKTLLFDYRAKKTVLIYTHGQKFSELSHFAINPNYQGLGIGSKLIKKAEKSARENNSIYLYTTTHNKMLLDYYKTSRSAEITFHLKISGLNHYCLVWKL